MFAPNVDQAPEVVVNQGTAEGWVDLGRYQFDAGTGGSVALSDLTGEPFDGQRVVFFDAVKWTPERPESAELTDVRFDRTRLAALAVQFEAGAVVEHVSVTGALNPAIAVTFAEACTPSPAMSLPDVGLNAVEKSTPLPVNVAVKPFNTAWPACGPVAVGVNVTLIVQLAPAASVVPQVVADCVKLVLDRPMDLTVIETVLVFVSVNTCAADTPPPA